MCPRALHVAPDGEVETGTDGLKVWFQPTPFLVCLRCGAAYDRREKNDFRKLTRLSHTGRSTATTLVSGSAIHVQFACRWERPRKSTEAVELHHRQSTGRVPAGRSLQRLYPSGTDPFRAAPGARVKAGSLDHASVTPAVFATLGIKQEAYAKAPSDVDPGKSRNEKAMMQLLAYRLYEDLRRGWRVIQPNLEQCGLLEIEYPGLKELCENEAKWAAHPVLQGASPECRYKAIYAFLDHLRREMAIDASVLDPAEEWDLRQRVQQNLRDPWAFDNDDIIRQSFLFVLPGTTGPEGFFEIVLSATGRSSEEFLRSRKTWDLQADIPTAAWEPFVLALVKDAERKFLATHENTYEEARGSAIGVLVSLEARNRHASST